jgi:hypothetical protein
MEFKVFALLWLERRRIPIRFNSPSVEHQGVQLRRCIEVPLVYEGDPTSVKEMVNMGREQ